MLTFKSQLLSLEVRDLAPSPPPLWKYKPTSIRNNEINFHCGLTYLRLSGDIHTMKNIAAVFEAYSQRPMDYKAQGESLRLNSEQSTINAKTPHHQEQDYSCY